MALYEIADNPEQEKNTYAASINTAITKFLAGDKKCMANAAGAFYNEQTGIIETIFVGRPYCVDCTDGSIRPKGHDNELRGLEISVVLHNLIVATGRNLTGKLVTVREFFKIGGVGGQEIRDASEMKFNKMFSDHPERLKLLTNEFACEMSTHGDASIKINLLPRVPITIAVWAGEGGIIPPEHTIMYDSTATDYLPLEDLVAAPLFMLEKFVTWGLKQKFSY